MNPLQIGKLDNPFFSVFIFFPTSIIRVSTVLFTPSLKSHSSLPQPTHHYPVSRLPLKPHLLHHPWRYTSFSSFLNLATALALPILYRPSLYTNKWICFCQQFIRFYKLKSLFLSSLIASFSTSSLTLLTIYSAMPISIITANEVLTWFAEPTPSHRPNRVGTGTLLNSWCLFSCPYFCVEQDQI